MNGTSSRTRSRAAREWRVLMRHRQDGPLSRCFLARRDTDAMRVTVRRLYSTATNTPIAKTVRSSFRIAYIHFLKHGSGNAIISLRYPTGPTTLPLHHMFLNNWSNLVKSEPKLLQRIFFVLFDGSFQVFRDKSRD
jgi:hypothetical protein